VTARDPLAEGLARLARYRELSLQQRNYRSAMFADLLADSLERVASVIRPSLEAAHESGQDRMAIDAGQLIRDMTAAGASDTEVLEAVQEMIIGRLETGLPPGKWFA
jgi:hypothetical protein